MRKLLLLGAFFGGMLTLPMLAQQPTTQWTGYLLPDPEPTPASAMRYAPGTVDPMPLTGGCPTNDAVGSSSNVFTQILTEANPVAVDNDINSIIFVHRN